MAVVVEQVQLLQYQAHKFNTLEVVAGALHLVVLVDLVLQAVVQAV
jgi:hypothetical protein